MKKRILVSLIFSLVIMSAEAITPDEYWDNIKHYFLNKNQSVVSDTIDIYTSGEKIPLRIDSSIFMFFNGIKAYEPDRYEEFSVQVKESNNSRLMRIIEVIGDYDLDNYIMDPKPSPVYVENLLLLFYSSGDMKFINMMYEFIQSYFNEELDRDKYLAGRSAVIVIQQLISDYPDMDASFRNNEIIDSPIKEYMLNTTPDAVRSEGMDFMKLQKEKGIWK